MSRSRARPDFVGLGAIDLGATDAYAVPDVGRLQTVVETPAYLKAARGVLSDALRATVVNMVAENPEAGVPLGGGVRKVRVARLGRGKSVGARVVFLFAGEDIPVFLLTVFAKNEKANLSNRDLTALIATAKELAADYRRDPWPRHSIRSGPGSTMRAPT